MAQSLLAGASVSLGQPTRPDESLTFQDWAPTPPLGWNSWDCFGAGVNEQETLANAEYMNKCMKSHGWSLITIDIQWYEPRAHTTAYRDDATLELDANGRLLPAANRFPSTAGSRSFKPIADKLHGMGLKFGVHLLRGIPRQAVKHNLPILGTNLHAADVADIENVCKWNGDMYGVNMIKPGAQAYYDSVFALLASWEIDFVKVDDLSRPYHTDEIEAIRKAIDKTGRPILLSTSPGATPLTSAQHIETHANQWRISDDFWDSWPLLYEQFSRLHAWTPYRGAGHWPDADMLPMGNIRTWENGWTKFTPDEQITMMTLWSIARSPLICGANLPKNDPFTLGLLTNDAVLAVDQHSTNGRQVVDAGDHVVWMADVSDSKDKYVALFNVEPRPVKQDRGKPPVPELAPTAPAKVGVTLNMLGLAGRCKVTDLWSGKELPAVGDELSAMVPSHGAVLVRLTPEP